MSGKLAFLQHPRTKRLQPRFYCDALISVKCIFMLNKSFAKNFRQKAFSPGTKAIKLFCHHKLEHLKLESISIPIEWSSWLTR